MWRLKSAAVYLKPQVYETEEGFDGSLSITLSGSKKGFDMHVIVEMTALLPPSNVVCEGYVFTPVCDSVNRGGGGVRGCSGGACMVAPGGGGVNMVARRIANM